MQRASEKRKQKEREAEIEKKEKDKARDGKESERGKERLTALLSTGEEKYNFIAKKSGIKRALPSH